MICPWVRRKKKYAAMAMVSINDFQGRVIYPLVNKQFAIENW
jgi:hypothetical protein